MSHTPGPWTIEHNVKAGDVVHLAIVNRTTDDWMVCSITPMKWKRPVDEANARLIAAAPQMFDLLKRIGASDRAAATELKKIGLGGCIDDNSLKFASEIDAIVKEIES